MSLGLLQLRVRALLAERGLDHAIAERAYVLAEVPRVQWDRQVGKYRRYVRFSPLGTPHVGGYGILWGQWAPRARGEDKAPLPDQLDSRSIGDLDFAVDFLRAWLVDAVDWRLISRGPLPAEREPIRLTLKEPAGLLFYSPSNAAHVDRGENYFERGFADSAKIADELRFSKLAAFSMDVAGAIELTINYGKPESHEVGLSHCVRLGLEVRDNAVCFRSLRDLESWDPVVPPSQIAPLTNGYYDVMVGSTPNPGGTTVLHFVFTASTDWVRIEHHGLPMLSPRAR